MPTFDDGSSRYDLSTYLGRVKHFWGLVNPLKSVFASQEELNADIALIQRWKVEKAAGLPHSVTDDERLWNAKERLAAVYHPDTGEKIPLPLRMAMFMPVNLPITAGMLLSPPGVMQLVFQTINQTYNAGFNYANRNATVPVDMTDVLASYLVATGTAVAAAHGLGKVVANLQNKMGGVPTLKVKLLSRGLPWLAVATAGSMNVLAMRYREAIDGITLESEDGTPQGVSVAAGRLALSQIVLTRVVLPIPILLLPPFFLDFLRSTKGLGAAMASSKAVRVGVELGVIAVFLQCALPLAIALFPQRGAVAASQLEPAFQHKVDASGKPLERFYFNKGV